MYWTTPESWSGSIPAVRWNYHVPMAVLARIVRIGNSGGLRIPKVLLETASLADWVELRAEPGKLTVSAVRSPRSGWIEAARQAHVAGDDRLLDPPSQTDFDESDWLWSAGRRPRLPVAGRSRDR